MQAPASTLQQAKTIEETHGWRPMRLLAVYRLLVAVVVGVGFGSGVEPLAIAAGMPNLFIQGAVGYFLFALVALILALQLNTRFKAQVIFQAVGDITGLLVLIYSAGISDNALGPLLMVAVAGLATLVNTRLAAFFAALATVGLLGQQFLQQMQSGADSFGYTQLGMLGLGIFITALGGNLLARRARESQALAEQRGIDLANQEALNGYIVQRLQDGIIVIDGDSNVRLLNAAAWSQLGRPKHDAEPTLSDLHAQLGDMIRAWRKNPQIEPEVLAPVNNGPEVQPRLQPLGQGRGGALLIFLEDLSELRAQVQQAKLVSLGRLTASIAHEIRNPLSAMTHAAQLLEEGELSDGDKRLLQIIIKQGARLNGIIEDVLRLSRREQPNREIILLYEWLEEFVREAGLQENLRAVRLDISEVPDDITLPFDGNHLNQVMTNLVRNAVEHGGAEGPVEVTITAGRDVSGRQWLEICDNGRGIPDDAAAHLFEPFFTTATTGTGLGLYLCSELCESNQARLTLREQEEGRGACFRITSSGALLS